MKVILLGREIKSYSGLSEGPGGLQGEGGVLNGRKRFTKLGLLRACSNRMRIGLIKDV